MKTLIVLAGALLLTMSIARAQETERGLRPPSVTANGEAVITVEPDQAEIDIGVVTQAKTAPDAARENADKLARVMGEAKKILGKHDFPPGKQCDFLSLFRRFFHCSISARG